MLRWTVSRHYARIPRQGCLTLARRWHPYVATDWTASTRWASSSTTFRQRAGDINVGGTRSAIEPPDYERVEFSDRTDAWLALLEPTWPPRLRENAQHPDGPQLTPVEMSQVLSAAQKTALDYHKQDVLSYIACEKGRWDVVAWLSKHLIESFGGPSSNAGARTDLLCAWKNDTPLSELTRAPVDPLRHDFLQQSPASDGGGSLNTATAHRGERDAAHEALGIVWRGLGNLTITCAEDEIKPEILEIIACLHHQGYMPSSIYDSKPSSDPTAIQQSPILNLLSSRILASLSDAAWRAHEKLIVEDDKGGAGQYASIRPRIAASAYRVRVAGVKPEVWLELILWSCLHGGWVPEGMAILEKLHSARGDSQWKPLSWRSLVTSHPTGAQDWDRVEYLFNNWTVASMDLDEPVVPVSVQRTISGEVVNAYVDASLSVLRPSHGQRGPSRSRVVQFIGRMQQFLGRSSLSLGTGSWDAIILRLFDLQDDTIYKPASFDKTIQLSPKMGQEIAASNAGSLPDYVFDGTAATFGLFHRALYHRIQQADVEGALRLFAALQERADENKRQSVVDFLRKRDLFASMDDQAGGTQFTNNFANIDYPAFYVQIPANILGPFIELVTDAKAYDFGKWLLYSDEIDGPIVPERLYGDASVTPALVRFAAETGDTALLSRLVKLRVASATEDGPTLPKKVLQSFLESQINLLRMPAAIKILQHLRDLHGIGWNVVTLCHLIRMSLLQVRRAGAGNGTAKGDLGRVRGLFRRIVQGDYEKKGAQPQYLQEQTDNLLVVLACLGEGWTGFSVNTRPVLGHRVFNIPSKAFNLVLEGVVDAYGSLAGRRLVGIFWNHTVRKAQLRETESDRRATYPPFSSFAQMMPAATRRQRTAIRFPGFSQTRVVMYGGLRPDLMTIRIVLKSAIEELVRGSAHQAENEPASALSANSPEAGTDELDDRGDPAIDTSPTGIVVWASRCLKRLGMTTEDLEQGLRQNLPESKLQQVLEKAPDLLTPREEQESVEAMAAAKAMWLTRA